MLTRSLSQGGHSSHAVAPSVHLAPKRQTRSFGAEHLYGAATGTDGSDVTESWNFTHTLAVAPESQRILSNCCTNLEDETLQVTATELAAVTPLMPCPTAKLEPPWPSLDLGFGGPVACSLVLNQGTSQTIKKGHVDTLTPYKNMPGTSYSASYPVCVISSGKNGHPACDSHKPSGSSPLRATCSTPPSSAPS